jgi:hypothetical protein
VAVVVEAVAEAEATNLFSPPSFSRGILKQCRSSTTTATPTMTPGRIASAAATAAAAKEIKK